MNIHEYQAKAILRKYGVNVPNGFLILSPDEISNHDLPPVVVVKAQIHAGGRGKAGGVKIAKNIEDAKKFSKEMLGKPLITDQNGPNGTIVRKVYIEYGQDIKQEIYLSFVLNRAKSCISLIVSAEGGVDIEELSVSHPEKVCRIAIDPIIGLRHYHIKYVASFLRLKDKLSMIDDMLRKLYDVFVKKDAVQLEINPLALLGDGSLMCLDAKLEFNDDAMFRQEDILAMRDLDEEDPSEVEASQYDLKYIKMEGDVACVVNGAGLAMATMDMIKLCGKEAANFLDVGGGADQEKVEAALKIILRDKGVKVMLVNIFGGIMKCDVIANAILMAAKSLSIKIPMIVRLEGTNSEIGRKILADQTHGLTIIPAVNLDDIALKLKKF